MFDPNRIIVSECCSDDGHALCGRFRDTKKIDVVDAEMSIGTVERDAARCEEGYDEGFTVWIEVAELREIDDGKSGGSTGGEIANFSSKVFDSIL